MTLVCKCMSLFVLSWLVFSGVGLEEASAGEGDTWRWVQHVPGGIEARVVTAQPSCPDLSIDGVETRMGVRASPGASYPVHVCALPIPPGAKQVLSQGVALPLPLAHPNRILIIGDTGCRLKDARVQACNDASQWPFRAGATMSAAFKPDLVIHVGDFQYRETSCPKDAKGCAGSPFGDTWDVWREDFFEPAGSLLAGAPWIMVRGNHEECQRGGKGWARALDPYGFDVKSGVDGCLRPSPSFMADVGGLTIQVMDVSSASEHLKRSQVGWYRDQFAAAANIQGSVWLAFHRPIWASNGAPDGEEQADNKTLAAAAQGTIPPNVQAFISGHHHTFEVMSYEQDLPVQIISGHGGDELLDTAPTTVKGLTINGVTVKDGVGRPGVFGFSMIERAADDTTGTWTLTGYDIAGRSIARCVMTGRAVSCD